MTITKEQEIISSAVLYLMHGGYNPRAMDDIATLSKVSMDELNKHFADYETLVFDVLRVITDSYVKKIFDIILTLNFKLSNEQIKAQYSFFVTEAHNFFFYSDLGKVYLIIDDALKEDVRFKSYLNVIKEEWMFVIKLAFAYINHNADEELYFNKLYLNAKRLRLSEVAPKHESIH